MTDTPLARRIKDLRMIRGDTLRDLAEKVGKSAAYLSKIENQGEIPSPELTFSIAQALETDPAELLNLAKRTRLMRIESEIDKEHARVVATQAGGNQLIASDHLVERLRSVTSWDEYILALREADSYWLAQSPLQFDGRIFSVLGPKSSWEATIERGRGIIANREDWTNLTDAEKGMLFGRWKSDGAWDLLGNMGAAVGAVARFKENRLNCCVEIGAALQRTIIADRPNVVQAFDEITRPHFGTAIATRLITLARPDLSISLNKGSVRGLSNLAGLKLQVDRQSYLQILKWLHDQLWYQAGAPSDPTQRVIWSMRAALIDCFVYERV